MIGLISYLKEAVGMTRSFTVFVSMIVIFAAVMAVWMIGWLSPAAGYPQARGGVLDLRNWDFAGQGAVPLRGEWEFYEGELLQPEDFAGRSASAAKRRLVDVPGGWQGVVTSHGDGYGAGTYRLTVRVPQPDIYSLRAKKIRMSSHIYMNGTDLGGNGKPSIGEPGFEPSNLPFYGSVSAREGGVEIIIQVASYRLLKGGLVQAPEFAANPVLMERRDNSRLADMALITTMLLFGLYYAGMFKQWNKEPYLKYFCFFCLSTGVFFCIDNEILATVLFPSIPFPILQKVLFLSSFLTFLFFCFYVYRYLNEPDHVFFRWLRRIVYAYFVVLVVLPNEYFIDTMPFNIVLQTATMGNIFYALFRSRKRNVHGAAYLALGVFFLTVTWIIAQFRYELALDNPYAMIVTPLLLVFSQAFLMSDRLQQAFRTSQRLSEQLMAYDRQKDEFLAKTSHELRTPLHGIINLSQSLLEDEAAPLQPQHRENIRLLHLVGRRLAGLVHDIMDMSLMKHGELRIRKTGVDLGVTARFVIETLSISPMNPRVKLVNELPAQLPLVFADENRLRQILHNLLENGLKFTDDGTVRISAAIAEDRLVVSVTDTGRGIPEEFRAMMFQPFVQHGEGGAHSPGGIGLGLNITQQLVQLHGSTLEVQSEVGSGSRFSFALPILDAWGEAAAAAEESGADSGSANVPSMSEVKRDEEPPAFTVMIVDDEPSNLKIIMDAAATMNVAYIAAQSGQEAIERLQGSAKPDLALVDLMMPGISGLDVCREIRKLYSHAELPVLMLTASGQLGDMIASFAAGANDILHKPFELAELKARMHSLISMKRSSEQAVRREIEFLQAQITPHFLYNSLNALVGLSYMDTDKLREMIHHLTTYLRAKFTFTFEERLVPIELELELVRAYLAIEQLRFGDRLQVSYRIEPGLYGLLPPLTLQPLVENAVRHGIGPKPEGGTIEISVARSGGGIEYTVADDGTGMDDEKRDELRNDQAGGIGIGNVSRRLHMLYGRQLDISSETGRGTTIKFRIPEGAAGTYVKSDSDR